MKFFRDVLLTGLICIAVLLFLEGMLRLTHERYNASLFQPDPERGYSLRPNAEGWNELGGEAYIHINSAGMRDFERPVERPKDTLRVALVGASIVEALEVPIEEDFAQAMDRNLKPIFDPLGKRVDVMNFGVAGYTLAQQYLTIHNHVWKFDPQVVVLVWDEFLILKNTLDTDPGGGEGDRIPFFSLHNGQLQVNEPTPSLRALRATDPRVIARRNRTADLMNKSALMSTVNWGRYELTNQIGGLRARLSEITSGNKKEQAAPTRPADYIQWWTFVPDLPELKEDWEIGEAFVREMKAECDRHGADFFVVLSDQGLQSHPDLEVRKAFMKRHDLRSLDESDQRLVKFCEANGIHVLALGPIMSDYALAHHAVLHGSGPENAGHWNKTGHEVVGRVLTDELLKQSAVVKSWTAGQGMTAAR